MYSTPPFEHNSEKPHDPAFSCLDNGSTKAQKAVNNKLGNGKVGNKKQGNRKIWQR